jgi:hypothetical protein
MDRGARTRKGKLMKTRTGLFLALLMVTAAAHAADVRPGTPQLLDPDTTVSCVVPTSFAVGGVPKRSLFMSTGGGIAVKQDGLPTRLLWGRATLYGGEQRTAGAFLATSYGLMHSTDGAQTRYLSSSRFPLVTPYGWVKDGDGLWTLSDTGLFNRSPLPVAPWRGVVGIAPSINYLYGPNLLWVGTTSGYSYYYSFNQRGMYQAVWVNGTTYPSIGLPDYQRVSALCGVTGGYYMVYNGMVLRHQDLADPYALLYTDTGLTPDTYALQSLRYSATDIDAVAYVGQTLWVNLGSVAPRSVRMPGSIRYVAIDSVRKELIVSTSAGVYALPYTLG